jgi:hypothetical protein
MQLDDAADLTGGIHHHVPGQIGARSLQRREFITLLGGAAAWPFAARAQQPERTRKIGVLIGADESDADRQMWIAEFHETLKELGWIDGHNIRTDWRWAAGDRSRAAAYATELVALEPDVLFGDNTFVVAELQQATRTLPIVFAMALDDDVLALGKPALAQSIHEGFACWLRRDGWVICKKANAIESTASSRARNRPPSSDMNSRRCVPDRPT